MLNRRRFLQGGVALAGLCLTGISRATAFQPLEGVARIIVGFPPGAGADTVARKLAEKLTGPYAANVIVENRPGAGGRIAAEAAKNAAGDGRTLLFTPASPMILAPHLYPDLSYDPRRDFLPITGISALKLGLVVNESCPATTLQAYEEWCQGDARRASFASPGAGTLPHFLGIRFAKAAGLDLVHIGYKGAGLALRDLIGDQVPAYVGILGADVIAQSREGRIRVLAVANTERSADLPDVPTFLELGYPGMVAEEWMGVFAPASAGAVAEPLDAILRQALEAPDVQELLQRYSMESIAWPSKVLGDRLSSDLEAWGPIVQDSGFKADS